LESNIGIKTKKMGENVQFTPRIITGTN